MARALAKGLRPGDFVALSAPLGAGKTVIAREIIRELIGEDIEVPSPTFSLVQHYAANPPITHADLYRLDDPSEVMELGLEDMLDDGVLLVEWPEHGEGFLPSATLRIVGSGGDGNRRVWTISGDQSLLAQVKEGLWRA